MKRKILISLTVSILLLTSFLSIIQVSAAGESWPTFMGNNERTGAVDNTGPKTNNLVWKWYSGYTMPPTGARATAEGSVALVPAVANGIVYVGTDNNRTVALDEFTGDLIWEVQMGDLVRCPPTVANGKVFIGSWDGYMYALDAATGEEVWKYGPTDLDEGISCGLLTMGSIVADGLVIYSTSHIYALDENTGDLVWKTKLPGTGAHSFGVALSDDILVYGGLDGIIYALDLTTGDQLWEFATESYVEAVPSIAYDKVYVGSTDNYTYCLDLSDGSLVWRTEHGWSDFWGFGGGGWSHAGVADDMVFTASPDGNRYVFDATTGDLVWKFQTGNVSWTGTAIVDGVAYFGNWDENIYAVDEFTGAKLWEFKTNGGMLSGVPAIADGMLFYGASTDGYLYAIGEPVLPSEGIQVEYIYVGVAVVAIIIIAVAVIVLKKKS